MSLPAASPAAVDARFHNLPRDTAVECRPPFRETSVPPGYPPITCGGEYAELRYRQAHGDHKQLKLAGGESRTVGHERGDETVP